MLNPYHDSRWLTMLSSHSSDRGQPLGLKWGGELTEAGINDAEARGRTLRASDSGWGSELVGQGLGLMMVDHSQLIMVIFHGEIISDD